MVLTGSRQSILRMREVLGRSRMSCPEIARKTKTSVLALALTFLPCLPEGRLSFLLFFLFSLWDKEENPQVAATVLNFRCRKRCNFICIRKAVNNRLNIYLYEQDIIISDYCNFYFHTESCN